jgi:hypothetical protein
MNYRFPENVFTVFGIQWPNVAEAVLKNNAGIVFGPSQNLAMTACEDDAALFSKTMRALLLRLSQNFLETARQNDAALFLKDNARIALGLSQM